MYLFLRRQPSARTLTVGLWGWPMGKVEGGGAHSVENPIVLWLCDKGTPTPWRS